MDPFSRLRSIDHKLDVVIARLPARSGSIDWSFGPVITPRLVRQGVPVEFNLNDTDQVLLTIKPLDAAGKPAQVDGPPDWGSTDSTVCSLNIAEDGMSATAVAGNPGVAHIRVSVDADLGEGVRTLVSSLQINVIGGEAQTFDIVPGAAEPQKS